MSDRVVKSTFELSAYVTAGVMADSERDTASCSGGDEDSRSGLHSPSASEDSVEVQVTPISLRNKRKLAEPRKIQEPSTAPLKKRRFHHIEETVVVTDEESRSRSTPSPFRPWIIPRTSSDASKTSTATTSTVTTMSGETTTTTTTTSPVSLTASSTASTLSKATSEGTIDDQPCAVVERREDGETHGDQDETMQRLQESLCRIQQATSHNRSVVLSRREPRQRLEAPSPVASAPAPSLPQLRLQEEPLSLVMRDEAPRVPSHPAVSGTYEKTPSYMMEHLLASSSRSHRNHRSHTSPQQQAQQRHQTVAVSSSSSSSSSHVRHHQGVTGGGGGSGNGGQQRNYKNMTRERRIEANARERTRVHTISAAFDTLRRAIPAYSHNQKLSKLSVLRIACSYIVTLTKIRKMLEGEAPSGASLADCVEQVSRTIQTEGKLRKRKDE